MKSANFLIDAGNGTGIGHLRRSGVLLDAMRKAGYVCRLFCRDPAIAAGLGRDAAILPARPEDLPESDVLVCDSYRLGAEDLHRFRQRSRVLLVFDDLCDRPIEADIVLNHNIYGGSLDYASVTDALILTGPECALVDDGVLDAAAVFGSAPSSDDVVFSFGGTDDGTRSAEVSQLLVRAIEGRMHIVVAPGVAPAALAASLATQMPSRISLHRGPDLPKLLSTARLYVGAAGVTALEAHVIGLDMLLCVIADNQRLNADAFARLGHTVLTGFDAPVAADQAAAILRRPYVARARTVDGQGAMRVLAAIERALSAKSLP